MFQFLFSWFSCTLSLDLVNIVLKVKALCYREKLVRVWKMKNFSSNKKKVTGKFKFLTLIIITSEYARNWSGFVIFI